MEQNHGSVVWAFAFHLSILWNGSLTRVSYKIHRSSFIIYIYTVKKLKPPARYLRGAKLYQVIYRFVYIPVYDNKHIYIYTKIIVLFIKSRYINPHFPLKLEFVQLHNLAIRRCFEWPLDCTNDFWAFIGTSLDEHAAPTPIGIPTCPTKNEAFPTTV